MTAEQTDIENAEAGTAGRSGPNFQPIKAKRAFEAVCEQIRREVALGTLKPGDRLPPEREFAEQLGVSRTAVREAMRSLENAGIVQCQQGMGGGAFIRKRDSSTVTQAVGDMVMLGQIPSHSVTEMRIILTEQAIRLACERATPLLQEGAPADGAPMYAQPLPKVGAPGPHARTHVRTHAGA